VGCVEGYDSLALLGSSTRPEAELAISQALNDLCYGSSKVAGILAKQKGPKLQARHGIRNSPSLRPLSQLRPSSKLDHPLSQAVRYLPNPHRHTRPHTATMGGFDFSNHNRNAALHAQGVPLPKATSTGTTIVGCLFDGGVVIAADTRATSGPIVADKVR
jgi:hypothetical protein